MFGMGYKFAHASAPMQPSFYLSDRGIRQAVDAGLIAFNPPLQDRQVQPASIDVLLEKVHHWFPIEEHRFTAEENEAMRQFLGKDVVPSHCDGELRTTQRIGLQYPLHVKTELRSSLRRLSCHIDVMGMTTLGYLGNVHVHLRNHGDINIEFSPGDRIAQLLFFFYKTGGVGAHEAGLEGFEREAETYKRLLTFDHGWAIDTYEEARKLLQEGYLNVAPKASFKRGLLRISAGKTAKVLRKDLTVKFSAKQDITDAFEEVRLPYTVKPKEHVVVGARESLKLSKHVGIHFYDHVHGTESGLKLDARGQTDIRLGTLPDGWVDPGFEGGFSRQPKTFFAPGRTISEGDVLGYGRIIFFPNGVERPYGSAGLGSHYQGDIQTSLVQK